MLSCNIGNYLIKCQSERYIIIAVKIILLTFHSRQLNKTIHRLLERALTLRYNMMAITVTNLEDYNRSCVIKENNI